MTIELRLTDVDPPTAEPARTIYRDIVNLPDPTILGITIRYFNYDDVGLYMQITGSKTGYTFSTVNLGLLASGANAYLNLDNFASRAKPTVSQLPNGEMSETITLTLKGYTDAGYSTLKWTFDRVVTVIWINSTDAAFTVNEVDNFDDGTVQGWVGQMIDYYDSYGDGTNTVNTVVATNYVLSPPYSCQLSIAHYNGYGAGTYYAWLRGQLYKAFTTPNKPKVFAIADVRINLVPQYDGYAFPYGKQLQILNGTAVLISLGKAPDNVASEYFPRQKWVRVVFPLPANTTLTLKILFALLVRISITGSLPQTNTAYLWLDDFKIISK